MKKKILFLMLAAFVFFSFYSSVNVFSQTIKRVPPKKRILVKQPLIKKPYRFEIQGIKRVLTTPTKVRIQVQYYISPHYPKPCFISAYVPNKGNQSSKFSYLPAGRRPNGVPKGQKHFTDNIFFEVNFRGPGSYTSKTIEVVIYEAGRNIKTTILNWGQTWGVAQPPRQADLVVHSISVSKYNPHRKTTFTFNIKNLGGTAVGPADISVWLYKLNANGSLPSTPNEYWEGTVPAGGGTIGPNQIKVWTHDKYEFMVEGNWRVKAKINPHRTLTESNYNNNVRIYNFTLPN